MREGVPQSAVSPSLFYRLIGVAVNKYGSHEEQTSQNNERYRILVITDGDGRLVMDGEGYRLERGKCFIAMPGITVRSEAGKHGLMCYELTFEVLQLIGEAGLTAADGQSHPSFPCVGEVNCSPFSQCLEWVEALYGQSLSETADELALFDQHMRFQELLRCIFRQNLAASLVQSSRQAVESTIELLRRDYGDPWTVSRMAAMANVGRWHYTRMFKEMTGQVPLQYLSGIRIDQAKHLLQSTDDRLFDIAQNVGFGNEFYFNRRFKQTVGLSPGQYRRHYREDIRVFAPFLEDFLLAVGITPIVQCSLSMWGTQSYLGLDHIPAVQLTNKQVVPLPCKPDLIMVDCGFPMQWDCGYFEKQAPLYRMSNQGEDWQATLRTVADLLGRGKNVKINEVIDNYERKADAARKKLRAIRHQTVAFLRVSADEILLYAGQDKGFTGPVLYGDLELTPHPLVQQLTRHVRRAALTPELLARLDADLLFVTFEMSEREKKRLLRTSLWQSLPAVQHNRVFEVDFLSWMNYGILSHSKKIDDVLRVLA
ncbi:helix-turn-helix domain-containing protein [Paenibacillus mendelii]|uniref:Helix-turn-helix domain-containing protein n=1 Tax=Paenibacillus mendelii TaxID=206163 RepID=A0ABV6JIY5_9BACL|nr:helix-turn-helix domain-containing protein [Paenibacillus mendelii]MCQ6558800.1 AraC family transcriptional regulator [Paenibacillus mendelii]